ncbi:hypothetical protein Bpfe_023017 [Biomphalaria pfeifferi]|uniref:Uncharacterized protein n=1 Tax=Biomphalaria pfeifferi TaxID=112525 RepID=A0AAD8B3Z2_BIOPF|nr:hypothetical protein Bpfe_023017 [Biomphalaria pfeifferi]
MFLWYKLLCLVAVTLNALACDDAKIQVLQSEFCKADVVFTGIILWANMSKNTRQVSFNIDNGEYTRFSQDASTNWIVPQPPTVKIPYVKEHQCDSKILPLEPNHYLVLANLSYYEDKLLNELSVPDCTSLIPINCIEGGVPKADICRK